MSFCIEIIYIFWEINYVWNFDVYGFRKWRNCIAILTTGIVEIRHCIDHKFLWTKFRGTTHFYYKILWTRVFITFDNLLKKLRSYSTINNSNKKHKRLNITFYSAYMQKSCTKLHKIESCKNIHICYAHLIKFKRYFLYIYDYQTRSKVRGVGSLVLCVFNIKNFLLQQKLGHRENSHDPDIIKNSFRTLFIK